MSETRESLWLHDRDRREYPALSGSHRARVAVVGGGITGLTTSLLLKEAGVEVAVVEAERVASGTTGHTTGKVTALHRLIYAQLEETFGRRTAAIFAEANLAALAQVEEFSRRFRAECNFTRRPAYTYTCQPARRVELEEEAAAADRAGLHVQLVRETELPFPVEAAIRLPDQASLHPGRYCSALAEAVEGDGSRVFERSRVVEVTEKGVFTADGEVTADQVVVATLLPFLDRGGHFVSNYPWRSYLLAVHLEGESPEGMYISAEDPVRSVAPATDSTRLLIGGESHKTGQDSNTGDRYRVLEEWARQHFPVREVDFSWSSQDYLPADGLPYVGPLHPFTRKLHVATGFGKWGLTRGTLAGMLIRDAILGRDNSWREVFQNHRLGFLRSPTRFLSENLNAGRRFVADRVSAYQGAEGAGPAPGEGRVWRTGKRTAASFREPEGKLHSVSPVCTHLGCYVTWNSAERSWDCPCHGSRFDRDGTILQGPALKRLQKIEDGEGPEAPG